MYLILYDICNDKTRQLLVKFLKNRGLYRLQKSVFAGDIKKNYIKEIIIESKKIIVEGEDSFIIIKVNKDIFKKMIWFGIDIDVEKYLKEKYIEVI
ncbi:CRISPR-associated protein Cas2 [Cetobacterium ceti]|uniref:CRISPR-associated endoribonuclease Cas2 n=1 Tax=Cetobacterium ceti TaxID=180163 RepID=A0A1T4K4X7_9FUSO|nr:CRISPR-associated endonuclease Cas2 [Cetobacterium ceti]SJZ37484.1 CRISPR-associated protein Cas2 [Cetobacterium ceti]